MRRCRLKLVRMRNLRRHELTDLAIYGDYFTVSVMPTAADGRGLRDKSEVSRRSRRMSSARGQLPTEHCTDHHAGSVMAIDPSRPLQAPERSCRIEPTHK